MDTDKIQINTNQTPEKKERLPILAVILFFLVIPVCTLGYASGVFGALGLPALILAAAIDVILALEIEKSIPKLIILLFVNLAPFVLLTYFSRSFGMSSSSLFVIALSLPIWLTLKMKLGRGASIAASAICATAVWCFVTAVDVVAVEGALGVAEINSYLERMIAPIGTVLSDMALDGSGSSSVVLTSSEINAAMYYFKAVLLGGAAAVMIVWAYLTTLVVRMLSGAFGTDWRLPGGMRVCVRGVMTDEGPKLNISQEHVVWRIEIDTVSAAVYIAVYALTLFSGGEAHLFHSVIMNLFIILSPGFIYCAVRDIVLGIRGKAPGGFGVTSIIICAVCMFMDPSLVIYILCALGVIAVFKDNRMRRNSEKMRKG